MSAVLQGMRSPVLPTAPPLAPWLDRTLVVALTLFGLFLPWAPAGVSVMLAVLAILALLAAPAVWRTQPWRDPVIAVGLVLLAYIALHTLWVSGWTPDTRKLVNRYHELLMAAVLLALFRLTSRPELFFRGIVVGVLGYAAAHWVALQAPPLADYLESRRISAGVIMLLTAFVLADLAPSQARPWLHRAAAAFLCATVIFAVDGRTGHLILLVLVAVAAWSHSPKRWRWAAFVVVPALVAAVALGSSAVQKRVAETMAGSAPDAAGRATSTGIRIELIRSGLHLSERYFVTGAGFTRYFEVNQQSVLERYGPEPVRRGDKWASTDNPHSEYVMQLVGGGVMALGLFLTWLTLPMLRRRPGRPEYALVALPLAFAVGCVFNAMLMDFVEGHFYVALLAWLLARASAADAPRPLEAT